ncbi:rod shape-determining protein RodA [Candidatus Entotheonella serta]|nr:rod shape-determining protein RodA [Candidatus Entotheonella serta]
MSHRIIIALLAVLSLTSLAFAADPTVYIIEPTDGAVVSNPVKVVFGLKGMGVAPAGVERDKTGHHHLIIDAELPDLKAPIPADENYRHFGSGQTETTLELSPGQHTLQLLLGDFVHIPHDPPVMSKKITITVK